MDTWTKTQLPADFNWQYWTKRWDRMQERYLVRREERFETMVHLVRATQDSVSCILDLGCGPGNLMNTLLESFPGTEAYGVDFDPTMLLLARERLARFDGRAQLVHADLRDESWVESVPRPLDAVVSATALHWLEPDELAALYRLLAGLLRPGGILLNADHVGSDHPPVQEAWERHRSEMRAREGNQDADDWDSFWGAYGRALGVDLGEVHGRVIGGWEGGVEDGLPLAWHLDRLWENGFRAVDCFWRCDCDAIYGGIRGEK